MSVQNGERLVTKQDLVDMYQGIFPYLGGMPEVLANKFSKGDLYSTDEKMIGQWIDGKPLYQKTISCGALPDYTSNVVSHGISDVDTIFIISVFGINSNGGCISIPFLMSDSAEKNVKAYVDRTSITIVSKGVDLSSYISSYATIQYTKTTDSPISIGNDTDYSTDEKIIGTWIDGSPVYQKTVSCGALLDTNEKMVAHGISNISRVIHWFGYSCNSAGTSYIVIPNAGNAGQTNTTIKCYVDTTNIYMTTAWNATGQTESYVTLQYTKTTN